MRVKSNENIQKQINRRLTIEELGILNRLRILVIKERLEHKHIVAGRTELEKIQMKNIDFELTKRGIYWRY